MHKALRYFSDIYIDGQAIPVWYRERCDAYFIKFYWNKKMGETLLCDMRLIIY
jgi:hypothetical protein